MNRLAKGGGQFGPHGCAQYLMEEELQELEIIVAEYKLEDDPDEGGGWSM